MHPDRRFYLSLAAIRSLCRSDQQRAGSALEDFTEYLQSNFTAITMTEPIPFEDELKHTKAYLSVEAMLYEENLQVVYGTPHTAFRLPALTLRKELRGVILITGAGLRIIDKIVEPVLEVTEGAARVLGMRAHLGKAGRVLPVLLYRLRNITLHYLQP